MAFNPIVATRFASSYTLYEGFSTELHISSTIAWPSITVDYANNGSSAEPPSRSYTGIIDGSDTNSTNLSGFVAILLPLSNESIFVQEPLPPDIGGLRCSVKWLKRIRRFV